MNRWIALFAVIGLFCVGVVVGAVGTHLIYAKRIAHHRVEDHAPPFPAHLFLGHLERRLDLTPEQRNEIEDILLASRREAESMRRDVRDRAGDLMRDATVEIEAVLTPEQRETFRRLRPNRRFRDSRPGERRHERQHEQRRRPTQNP